MENKFDYTAITEFPGQKASMEQLARLYQRYRFAKKYARGKDVLEVACGSGIGMKYLGAVAKSVRGGDVDEKNVGFAKKHYEDKKKVWVDKMDARELALPSDRFDLVLLFEAIYYLDKPKKFVSEAKRVLRDKGTLIMCTVNRDWEDFHPSPFVHKYFSVSETYDLLKEEFVNIQFFGGFLTTKKGFKDKVISIIKHIAMDAGLIPGSLTARAHLKRIFMGKLSPVPAEVYDGMTSYEQPVEIPCDKACKNYKIIYAVATK